MSHLRAVLASAVATVFAVTAFLLLPASLVAQEDPEPEKYDATWYAVVQLDFEQGKTADALDIIKNYFAPAATEAGSPLPVMVLQHQSGEWDLTLIWHMERGPAGMEWKQTPEGIASQKALRELAGGEEEAQEIGEEWQSYISRSNVTITFQEADLPGGMQ